MPIAFSIKVAFSVLFIILYTFVLGDGNLSEDAGVFMRESKMLRDVASESPSAYMKFMTGIGEDIALVKKHLPETSHWDLGVQTIVNDNKNILRVHSLIQFISFNSPMIHAIILSLIALLGIKQLFHAGRILTNIKENYIFWGILLLPSLLFWTSSILKEPFMILGLGLLFRGLFDPSLNRKSLWYGIIGVIVLLLFKPYVLLAIIPTLFFFFIAQFLPKRKIIGSIGILSLLFITILLVFKGPREKSLQIISRKQLDFINVAKGGIHVYADTVFYYFSPEQIPELEIRNDSVSIKRDINAQILKLGQIDDPIDVRLKADNNAWPIYFMNDRSNGYIELNKINNSGAQLIKNIPEALINALFRPTPIDPGGKLNYVAFLETLLIFGFLVWSILKRATLSESNRVILVGLIIFAASISLIIGWVTPVVGAIARYRIPVYVALLFIAGLLFNPKSRTNE